MSRDSDELLWDEVDEPTPAIKRLTPEEQKRVRRKIYELWEKLLLSLELDEHVRLISRASFMAHMGALDCDDVPVLERLFREHNIQ